MDGAACVQLCSDPPIFKYKLTALTFRICLVHSYWYLLYHSFIILNLIAASFWNEMCKKITSVVPVKEVLITVNGTYLFNEFRVGFPIQSFTTILKKHETVPVLIQINSFHICETYIFITHFNIIPNIKLYIWSSLLSSVLQAETLNLVFIYPVSLISP